MSWTKKQLIAQAFDALGLASYVFDLSPEQLQSAGQKMDAMIAGWEAGGVRIAYALCCDPDGLDLNKNSGIPDYAVEAVYLNLALRIAPTVGKQVTLETRIAAADAYAYMLKKMVSNVPKTQLPSGFPMGAGSAAKVYVRDVSDLSTGNDHILKMS